MLVRMVVFKINFTHIKDYHSAERELDQNTGSGGQNSVGMDLLLVW